MITKAMGPKRHDPVHANRVATVSARVRDLAQLFNSLDASPFWNRASRRSPRRVRRAGIRMPHEPGALFREPMMRQALNLRSDGWSRARAARAAPTLKRGERTHA